MPSYLDSSGGEEGIEYLGGGTCLSCGRGTVRPILVLDRTGYHPSDPRHSIGYNHLFLGRCDACGAGQVERLDHDCFDWEEVWDQYEWYLLDADGTATLSSLLDACPTPFSGFCTCSLHAALSESQLPRSSWEWALEHDAHVHRVVVEVRKDGRPVLKPASS